LSESPLPVDTRVFTEHLAVAELTEEVAERRGNIGLICDLRSSRMLYSHGYDSRTDSLYEVGKAEGIWRYLAGRADGRPRRDFRSGTLRAHVIVEGNSGGRGEQRRGNQRGSQPA
jgi:hypothetical protein